MLYKILLIASLAAGPFTHWMSLFVTVIALAAILSDQLWERLPVDLIEETDQ